MPEYLAPGVYTEEVSFRPKSIEGVGTSTTAFVGPTRKGPLTGTPEIITSFGEFTRIFGGVADLSFSDATDPDYHHVNYLAHAVRNFFNEGGARLYVARVFSRRDPAADGVAHSDPLAAGAGTVAFLARMPGAGLNGQVNLFEKRVPATAATLRAAPEGSLARTGGAAARTAARLEGGPAPFQLADGDTLTLTLTGGSAAVTFTGAAVQTTGDDLGATVDVPANASFGLTAAGVTQSVDLPPGTQDVAELVALLNSNLRYVAVTLAGAAIQITTDARGTDAGLSVPQNDLLGFTADFAGTGTGNVRNLDAVTVGELDTLLQTANPNVRANVVPVTGALVISTTAGDPPTLTAADNAARVALGLPTATATGTGGATPQFFAKSGTTWSGTGGTLDVAAADPTTTELVTMNVETVDGDGNRILHDDVGFSATHPRYLGTALAQNPARRGDALSAPYFLQVNGTVTASQLHAALFAGGRATSVAVTRGEDGRLPVGSDSAAGAAGYDQALARLEDLQDISIVAAPGHSALPSYQTVQSALISHAERMRYRIAVLDTAPALTPGAAREARSRIDSSHAAMYYPWIVVANPLARPGDPSTAGEISLPPSGFMAGIYARSDNTVGVWKAPANEVVRGALRFERDISHGVQEVLNPEGINCLRYFYGRGYRVWGARTTSSDPEWKYVNIRRYFIYLEASIDRSTQWVVFMPNGEALWANVRATIEAFLYNEWRSGALLGTTPEEAYFVRCDRSTMTQNDIDNGRLICEIGVAAVKPAEFVIFRIGQKTADARS